MIKRNNKKGFTIVELVIVIAVIAILAAVLIPTFAGIIRKANISADTQLVKNMNTALAADEAINGKPENFSEVLTVFRENGYIVSNLNPTAANCYFVWESSTNQIILVDAKNNYEVIYASKELASEEPCDTWYFTVNDSTKVAEIKALGSTTHPNVIYTPKNAENLKAALTDIFSKTGTVVESIVVSDDIVINDTEKYVLSNKDATITIDLGDKSVNTSDDITVRPYEVTAGKLTVTGGTIIATGEKLATPTNNQAGAGTGSYGSFLVTGEDSSLILDDMDLANSRPWGLNIKVQDGATADIKNTTITSSYGGGIEASGSVVNVENATITQTGKHDHCSTCVSVSGGGTLNVKSGIFNAENYGVYVFSSGGTINISGGTFNETGANAILFKLDTGNKDAEGNYDDVDAVLNISGGTFTINGTTYTHSQMLTMNETELLNLVDGAQRVVISGNTISFVRDSLSGN